MSDTRKRGATSQMVRIFIPDNSVTTGAGCTGLVYNSTNLVIQYIRELSGTAVAYHAADGDIETITNIGTFQAPSSNCCRFKAVDATNFPGLYEIHFADATAFGSGDLSNKVQINVREATTTALKIGPNMKEVELTTHDPNDIKSVVAEALSDINLDHLIKTAKDVSWAVTVTKESVIDLMTSKDSSQTFARATDSLEGVRDLAVPDLLNTINTGATYNIGNSVGRQIRQGAGTATATILSGTAQAGSTSNTIKLPAAASATDNIYNGATIVLTGGVGLGQTRRIVAYNGTTKFATVDKTWVVTPTNSTTFDIIAGSSSIVAFEGVAVGGGNDYVDLPSTAVATDDYYSGHVVIESGTGAGQSKEITDYTGSSRRISINPETWAVNPSTDSVVAIIPPGASAVDEVVFPTAAEIASAIGARIAEAQGSYTYDQILSIVLSVLAGVTDDRGATFKTPDGVETRAAATVNADNERTAMTLTP